MAGPGRVPPPELNLRPSLRPAPVVDVVAVRPPNLDGAGSNLMRIADSLAGFGNALTRYGISAKQAQPKEPENLRPKIYAPLSAEEYTKVPGFDINDKVDRVHVAEKTAAEAGEALVSGWRESFDPSKETFDQFLDRNFMEAQQNLPDDEMKAGFGPVWATYAKKAREDYAKYENETRKEYEGENAIGALWGVSQPREGADTPELRAASVMQRLDELHKFKFKSPDEINDIQLKLMERYAADGDLDMVRALGNAGRGADGSLPPLAETPTHRDKFLSIETKANAEWNKRNTDKANMFDEGLNERIAGGTPNQLTDWFNSDVGKELYPDERERNTKLQDAVKKQQEANRKKAEEQLVVGAETSIGGKAVRDFWSATGTQDYEEVPVVLEGKEVAVIKSDEVGEKKVNEDISKRYADVADDPNAVAGMDDRVARSAGKSPFKIKEWERINGTLPSQVNSLALEQGKVTPQLKRGYELWKNTKDHREVYLSKGGPNAEKLDDFYAIVDDRIENGEELDVALSMAARASQAPKPEINKRKNNTIRDNPGLSSRLDSLPVKEAVKIERRVELRVANGADPKDAYEKELEAAEGNVADIDGSKLSYPKGIDTPEKKEMFSQSMLGILERQRELAGKQDMPIDPDALTIFDNGDGTYSLLEDGLPMAAMFSHKGPAGEEGVARFTLEDVDREMKYREKELQAEKMKEVTRQPDDPIFPKGQSAIQYAKEAIFGPSDPAKPETKEKKEGIFAGFTDNPEKYYGAKTPSHLRKLSDHQINELYKMSVRGWTDKYGRRQTLEPNAFVDGDKVYREWKRRQKKKP